MPTVLAIDIGGSKLILAYVNLENGDMIEKVEAPFSQIPTKEDVLFQIKKLASRLSQETEYDAVGIAVPALCDAPNGIWSYSPYSGIRDFNIIAELSDLYIAAND